MISKTKQLLCQWERINFVQTTPGTNCSQVPCFTKISLKDFFLAKLHWYITMGGVRDVYFSKKTDICMIYTYILTLCILTCVQYFPWLPPANFDQTGQRACLLLSLHQNIGALSPWSALVLWPTLMLTRHFWACPNFALGRCLLFPSIRFVLRRLGFCGLGRVLRIASGV